MVDNVEAASGSGGATFKTDEDTDASAHVPVTKIELGSNNSFDGYVADSNPMPVKVKEEPSGRFDTFGKLTTAYSVNDIDIPFFRGSAPSDFVDVTTANSATATQNTGGALFASSTNADGSVQGVSRNPISYRSGTEIYCEFTASFTAGIASSHMRIGLYDANDGFFIGYEGTSFGVTVRNNTTDTTVAKASFSEDDLTGSAGSKFTRAGTAEAIDLTKINLFRIRFGWLGTAVVTWEVMSPDGEWVAFHKTLFPNLQATPSIENPDLKMQVDITKTSAAATDLQIQTNCWLSGTNKSVNTGILSAGNSSTTALGSGATFTGVGEKSEFPDVMVSCKCDNTGTLYFDFSNDGTNWDTFPVNGFAVASGIHEFHAALKGPRFFRVRLVNDTGAQTYLRLYTYFGNYPKIPNAPLNQSLGTDSDAVTVKAVLSGQDPDGSFVNVGVNKFGAPYVEPEQTSVLDALDATTGWSALNNDTTNLALTTNHVIGTGALTFDKADGAANTVFACIEKTITSVDLGQVSTHDIFQTVCYVSDTTNANYIFLRVGTDSSNYNEWRITAADIVAGEWTSLVFNVGSPSNAGNTGNGWDSTAVTYLAVGVAFNSETDTLTGIIFDEVSFHTNTHSSTSLNSEVTSSVNTSNINVSKINNKNINTQSGNVGTGTQRVTIANDDTNLAAIKTAAELIDDAIYVDDADWTATTSKHMLSGGVYVSAGRTVTDGDTAPVALDSAGHMFVNLGSNNDIQGDVAHDAADSGNPVKIGAKVETSLKGITVSADADRTDLYADADGVQIVKVGTTGADLISERVSDTGGTSTAFTNFSAVASTYNYVTAIVAHNSHASTGGYIDFRDGTAGSVLYTVPIPAGGGVVLPAGATPYFKTSANTALAYDVSAAISTVYISVSGYQSKV